MSIKVHRLETIFIISVKILGTIKTIISLTVPYLSTFKKKSINLDLLTIY